MKSWEHFGKTWYNIDISLAIKNIKSGSIVKCKINDKGYLFNIPDEVNQDINNEMIVNGKWYVYTWSD